MTIEQMNDISLARVESREHNGSVPAKKRKERAYMGN